MNSFKINYSSRRTLGVYILKDGSVEVRAPQNCPKDIINAFVNKNREKISSNVEARLEKNAAINSYIPSYGDLFPLLGINFPVLPSTAGSKSYFDGHAFFIPERLEIIPEMQSLYKTAAKEYIPQRCEYFSAIMKSSPRSVKINSAKGRWGSCSGRNSLNFFMFSDALPEGRGRLCDYS